MTMPHSSTKPTRSASSLRTTLAAWLLASGLLAGGAARAQDYETRQISGWTVAPSEDGRGCFLSKEYAGTGGTTLLLGLDIDDTNHLSVLNANWSIRPKDRLKLNFRLSNGGYLKHFAVGMTSEGKQGFVTTFDAKFPTYFATSKAMHISRGDVPFDQLILTGSGAAVAALRECVAAHRSRPAAASNDKRPSNIPRDPFAPAAKRKSKN